MVGNNVALIVAIVSVAVPFGSSFSEEFTRIDGDDIKNNPKAQEILSKIEESRQRIKEMKESRQKQVQQQKFVEEQRAIAQANLQKELSSMNKKFEDHTSRNAFSSFVSGVDSDIQGIFWDQFNYLDAKVKVANSARNNILENGGSYFEAQQEYYKYVSMPKIEMINVIQDLNVQHKFSDSSMQSYFDAYGQLPRFEDDSQAPCYGCQKYQEIRDNTYDSEEIPKTNFESKAESHVNQQEPDNSKTEIRDLKERLSDLRGEFVKSANLDNQKSLINSMNNVIKKMQQLQSEKNL